MFTPAAAAISTDLCIVDGSPACQPHATLTVVTSLTSSLSSPRFHRPKLSAMSALMSIRLVTFVSSPIIVWCAHF